MLHRTKIFKMFAEVCMYVFVCIQHLFSQRPWRGFSGALKGCSESVPNNSYFLSLSNRYVLISCFEMLLFAAIWTRVAAGRLFHAIAILEVSKCKILSCCCYFQPSLHVLSLEILETRLHVLRLHCAFFQISILSEVCSFEAMRNIVCSIL